MNGRNLTHNAGLFLVAVQRHFPRFLLLDPLFLWSLPLLYFLAMPESNFQPLITDVATWAASTSFEDIAARDFLVDFGFLPFIPLQ